MVKSLEDEPEVTVTSWGIMHDRSGFRLVGMCSTPRLTQHGRVSSPIVEYDEHAQTVRTSSGRRYHLSGPPDDRIAAALIRAHMHKWELAITDVALADPREIALSLAPRPQGGLN